MKLQNKFMLALQALSLTACLTLINSLAARPVLAQTSAVQAGYGFLERGWVDDAIREFQRALEQQPQSTAAQLGLAIAYQRAGQDAQAWQTYQQILALEPSNREALAAIGQLGSYRPEWQAEGIAALTTLLQQTPTDVSLRAQRALLLGYQGRFAEAIADYEQVLAASPAPETVLGAAQIYTYSGNYAQGLTLFERYLATGRSLPAAGLIAYAETLQQTGRPAEAIALLSRQFQTASDSADLRSALAVAYQRNQQTAEALNILAPLRDRPEATLPLARALSQIGRQTGDMVLYQEAALLYQQALATSIEPSVGLVAEVAEVLSEVPALQPEALRLYEQLLAQTPAQPALQIKRLLLAYELGQVSQTDMQIQLLSLLQPLPANAVLQQQVGQALIRLDNPAPALLPIYQSLMDAAVPVDFLAFRVAQMQMIQGNWQAARAAIATYQATPTGQQDLAPVLLLAELERRQDNLAASIAQYEAILNQTESPTVTETALLGLSGIYQSQQHWSLALATYDRLVAQQPQSKRGRLGQTYLALRLQRLSVAQAESVLRDWLAAHSNLTASVVSPELLDLVGTLPPEPARQTLYETLLAITPTHIGLNRRYVQLLAQTDKNRAIAYVQQLTTAQPTAVGLYFVQGEMAQVLGELDLASQAYTAILIQQPENTDTLAALGGVRFQQRRLEEAIALFQQVLALKPGDWQIRRILAELRLAQDQPIAALQQFAELQTDEAAIEVTSPLAYRMQDIRLNFLRRRGFQPNWERY